MTIKPIPEGYHTVSPYLVVRHPDEMIEFLEGAFRAKVHKCMKEPGGRLANAEIQIGNSMVMMAEVQGDMSPSNAMLYLYVDDTDQWFRRAKAFGAKILMEPQTMFYGDRHFGLEDPSGNSWWVASRVEDVSDDELARRSVDHAS